MTTNEIIKPLVKCSNLKAKDLRLLGHSTHQSPEMLARYEVSSQLQEYILHITKRRVHVASVHQ